VSTPSAARQRKSFLRIVSLRIIPSAGGRVELHDCTFVGIPTDRIERDRLWAFVGTKQKRTKQYEIERGYQHTFVAVGSSSRATIRYCTGKRDSTNTRDLIQDLRQRALGAPEISAGGFKPYQFAVREAFRQSAFRTVNKSCSVTHLNATEASRRCSPAEVVAATRDAVSGVPMEISTSCDSSGRKRDGSSRASGKMTAERKAIEGGCIDQSWLDRLIALGRRYSGTSAAGPALTRPDDCSGRFLTHCGFGNRFQTSSQQT
jgi:hypothetical protein